MSTATPPSTPAPPPLASLQASARTLFVGLLWGGALLIILALWVSLKFAAEDRSPAMPWIIGVLGGVGLVLAGWHAFVLWLQKIPPEQKPAALANQRRLTALALVGGGAALLVIAMILGLAPRAGGSGGWAALRPVFGEAVGLFLFALVTLATGRALMSPPRNVFATVDLAPMQPLFPLIRAVLFLLGLGCVTTFAILAFYVRVGTTYFPELAGLLLFSMLCLALALWLTSTPSVDAFATRVFVLIFGGAAGLILFLMTLARAYVWRDQVFFAGMTTWEGEESWKLWLCVYLQSIALALMFGSLLLARADVRTSAVLRRMLFGYNAVLNGLLVLEMLIVLNIVFYAMVPYTFDWTRTRGLHSLAQSSKGLLHKLRKPTHVYVLMSQGVSMQGDVRTLIDNMEAESSKVNVKFISPDRETGMLEYAELAKKFPKILPSGGAKFMSRDDTGRGILIVYGDLPKGEDHNIPYAFIPERKIYDEQPAMGPGQRGSRSFKGEIEVMKELNYLVVGQKKRKLYFLQGDNEIDISETQPNLRRVDPRGEMSLLGAATLIDKLKKDNYNVEAITFNKQFADDPKQKGEKVRYIGAAGPDKQPQIPDPDEVYALVIAGASSPLSQDALNALEKYVDKGGKLMVLFDIVLTKNLKAKDIRDFKLRESGIEDMLKRYGIASTDEFAVAQMVPRTRAWGSIQNPVHVAGQNRECDRQAILRPDRLFQHGPGHSPGGGPGWPLQGRAGVRDDSLAAGRPQRLSRCHRGAQRHRVQESL